MGRRGFLLFATASRPPLGLTQPPIQWEPGALIPGVKRPGREADYSPPSSAEVKNAWSYTSTLLHVSMSWYLVKHVVVVIITILLHGAEYLKS
jgi:hypothetical protein